MRETSRPRVDHRCAVTCHTRYKATGEEAPVPQAVRRSRAVKRSRAVRERVTGCQGVTGRQEVTGCQGVRAGRGSPASSRPQPSAGLQSTGRARAFTQLTSFNETDPHKVKEELKKNKKDFWTTMKGLRVTQAAAHEERQGRHLSTCDLFGQRDDRKPSRSKQIDKKSAEHFFQNHQNDDMKYSFYIHYHRRYQMKINLKNFCRHYDVSLKF